MNKRERVMVFILSLVIVLSIGIVGGFYVSENRHVMVQTVDRIEVGGDWDMMQNQQTRLIQPKQHFKLGAVYHEGMVY
jgi:hypothetical protein